MRVLETKYIEESCINCNHCGALIGFYPADIKNKYISNFIFKYFKCPVCGENIVLSRTREDEYKKDVQS